MIRSLRDEVERYGHYSLAAESMYDHPFQWGSKRTGPDLARVGGKYSDEWHPLHMQDPRAVVPESVHARLSASGAQRELDYVDMADQMKANCVTGVPYTDEMIENARADVERQINPAAEGVKEFLARYPKAQVRNFDADPSPTSPSSMP